MKKGINVLSLFDGMSCGLIALKKLGITINKYYASEIKKQAIFCAKQNHGDDIKHIGDVTKIRYKDGMLYTEKGDFEVGHIDLLIGGSPCQDFSILKVNREGLAGDKSKLFYEYLRIKNEVKPTHFLLENVKMKKTSEAELNKYMGVDGIHIDSKLLTYQTRARVYWTNIEGVSVPKDKNVNFQDYVGMGDIEQARVNKTVSRINMWNNGGGRTNIKACTNVTKATKVGCLTRKQDRSPNSGLVSLDDFCRYLTRRELEQAQTVPLGYTDCLSYNQAQDLLGDGWTIDVIAHILENLKHEIK